MAIAETGSVLVAENALVDRAVSMLSLTVVQVVDRERVVGSLDDVAGWLAERGSTAGYSALVTGPSRTADIERSLTIGVQGPAAVHVVLLG
jgi:L-lactate dehydrogenase complex protein LldG